METETLKCSSPINLKRKSDDLPCYEDGKRFRSNCGPGSPKGELHGAALELPGAAAETEVINNNYKALEEEDDTPSFGSDSEEKEAAETSVASTPVSSKEEMYQR